MRPVQRVPGVFAALWASTFAAFNVTALVTGAEPVSPASLLYVGLLQFSWVGFAYDCSELLIALFSSPHQPRRVTELVSAPSPRVAIVCCVCDDVNERALASLRTQEYERADIFILDDSEHEDSRFTVDASGLTVVRRDHRRGFKAGNLNNWLQLYGHEFDLMIVADADSILPASFTSEMASYAQHPANSLIAVFESLIRPWNSNTQFARCQVTSAAIQHQIALRVNNALGATLSVGHNNMYRVAPLRAIGGFREDYVAEDYATCLELLRSHQWSCVTVPVTSYEEAPRDIYVYSRRQARWAAQTFQLSTMSLEAIPWMVSLKLLRSIHHYSNYIVVSVAVLLTCLVSFAAGPANESVMQVDASPFPFGVLWLTMLSLPFIMRYILARRAGISLNTYSSSVVFDAAVYCASVGPVIVGLAMAYSRRIVHFVPSGKRSTTSTRSLLMITAGSTGLGCFAVAALLTGSIHGANVAWIAPLIAAPALVSYMGRTSCGG